MGQKNAPKWLPPLQGCRYAAEMNNRMNQKNYSPHTRYHHLYKRWHWLNFLTRVLYIVIRYISSGGPETPSDDGRLCPIVPRLAEFRFGDDYGTTILGEMWWDRPGAVTARVEIRCHDRATAPYFFHLEIADRPDAFALVRMVADRLQAVSKVRQSGYSTLYGKEGSQC